MIHGSSIGGALATALLLAACGGIDDPGRPVNVLWISLDTLRADRLSCYGNARETSPAIDALAGEGVLFERALSSSSWTLPAHASMLTGLPVSAHGVCFKVHPEVRGTFIAERMRGAGYATAGFYSQAYLEREFFSSGFDTWERTGSLIARRRELRAEWERAEASGDEEEKRRVLDEHRTTVGHARPEADEGVDRAIEWLEGNRVSDAARPFFLFLHVFDIHSPYHPPPPFDRMFDPDYDGDIESVVVRSQRPGPDDTLMPHPDEDPEGFHRAFALYDGEIAWVDSQVRRLLTRLDELGLREDTLVIVTSDHGDEFFEHGQTGHCKTLLRESVHVPLVLRLPAAFSGGARVTTPVSIVDIAPTVLALTGVDGAAELPGVDLTSLARGGNGGDRTVLSELLWAADPEHPTWQISLYREGEHVIVLQPGTDDATAVRYDLETDPLELGAGERIVWDSAEGIELAGELERWRAELRKLKSRAQPRGEKVSELTEFESEELRALGYLGSDVLAEGEGERLCMEGCIWRRE